MTTSAHRPRVVIVGGGFAGLAAARGLRRADVDVLLVDRRNHFLFQPLLYQVATAYLTPGQIAAAHREILRGQANVTVLLADVVGVDVERRTLALERPELGPATVPYDYAVFATGVEQSWLGHDEFARFAPALKTLDDALAIRARVLESFELAELGADSGAHPEYLTFVLVGAGPTGCEMAGAISEMARDSLKSDFRRIDPRKARVVLLEAGPRILAGFDEELARRAAERLERKGVEIRTSCMVEAIDARGVVAGGERIESRTVIWTAGVRPPPLARWLGAPTDRSGRVAVAPDLSVPGRPELFVAGDVAYVESGGRPLPGVAQVALQQGRHVARAVRARVAGRPAPPFRYSDRGNLALIGRDFALLETRRTRTAGRLAWLVWIFIHVLYLPLPGNRLMVAVQWVWSYFTRRSTSRLILREGAERDLRAWTAPPALPAPPASGPPPDPRTPAPRRGA